MLLRRALPDTRQSLVHPFPIYEMGSDQFLARHPAFDSAHSLDVESPEKSFLCIVNMHVPRNVISDEPFDAISASNDLSLSSKILPRELVVDLKSSFRRAAAATHAKRRPGFQTNTPAACAPQNAQIQSLFEQLPQILKHGVFFVRARAIGEKELLAQVQCSSLHSHGTKPVPYRSQEFILYT
jgi:hypothetical protein